MSKICFEASKIHPTGKENAMVIIIKWTHGFDFSIIKIIVIDPIAQKQYKTTWSFK